MEPSPQKPPHERDAAFTMFAHKRRGCFQREKTSICGKEETGRIRTPGAYTCRLLCKLVNTVRQFAPLKHYDVRARLGVDRINVCASLPPGSRRVLTIYETVTPPEFVFVSFYSVTRM